MRFKPLLVITLALGLSVGVRSPAISATELGVDTDASSKCEIHVWAIDMVFSREWGMATFGGQAASPVSQLTTTVASRMKAVLTADAQLDIAKKTGLLEYFPQDRNILHFEGGIKREEFAVSLKEKGRLRKSSATCYVDFIILYNKYEDMMFGRRRLYTAITVRDFSRKRVKSRTKEMIDPLNEIDEKFEEGRIEAVDAEILDSLSNNLREFFEEAPKKY